MDRAIGKGRVLLDDNPLFKNPGVWLPERGPGDGDVQPVVPRGWAPFTLPFLLSRGPSVQNWHDEYLTWDPEEFGGIEMIKPPAKLVWQPDLTLYGMLGIRRPLHCPLLQGEGEGDD